MIVPKEQSIQSLVADISDGKLLLPELQRGYVWKAVQVRDLFDSLYHEYPSGKLLVWEQTIYLHRAIAHHQLKGFLATEPPIWSRFVWYYLE